MQLLLKPAQTPNAYILVYAVVQLLLKPAQMSMLSVQAVAQLLLKPDQTPNALRVGRSDAILVQAEVQLLDKFAQTLNALAYLLSRCSIS